MVPLVHVYGVVYVLMSTVAHVTVLGSTPAMPVPNVPAAHATHTVSPVVVEYVPGLQLKQVLALDADEVVE